jgi:hypothetical protein
MIFCHVENNSDNKYQHPTSDTIPPEILQCIGEFPPLLASRISIKPGPTFLELRLKKKFTSSSFSNACCWIMAIFLLPEGWMLYGFLVGLILSVLLSVLMVRRAEAPFLAIDLANQMIFSGNREIKFDDLIELQLVRKTPAPGPRFVSFPTFGLLVRNRENLLSSIAFQSYSRSPMIWQDLGQYLARQLTKFMGYTISFNTTYTEETTTENIVNLI